MKNEKREENKGGEKMKEVIIMPKTIELKFEGPLEKEKFPLGDEYNCSGIYTVYAGTIIFFDGWDEPYDYEIHRLLYIGEAKDLSERLDIQSEQPDELKHDKYEKWENQLEDEEILLFAVAKVSSKDREQAEAALIYYHHNVRKLELPYNKQNKKSFNYSDTIIKTSGYNELLDDEFTVKGDSEVE